MSLRLIALAALAAVGSAHALSPTAIEAARTAGTLKEIYIAGGSSQRLFLGDWFRNQCDPASFDVFYDGTSTTPTGNNYRAYSCKLAVKVGTYAKGTLVVLHKRDLGSAYQGVGPVATNTAQDFMHLGSGNCIATIYPTTSDVTTPTYACNLTTPDSVVAHGGVSDVEPLLFLRKENLPASANPVPTTAQITGLDRAPINQAIHGIIVNKRAYLALQMTQGLDNAGAIDDSPAKMPSLPSAWVASVMGGLASGGASGSNGWGTVISSSVDASVESRAVNYCRRTIGAAQQASIAAVLLKSGCQAPSFEIKPAGQTIGATSSTDYSPPDTFAASGGFLIRSQATTGNMITCVGGTATGSTAEGTAGAYALGIISRDNSPLPTVGSNAGKDLGFRFVKIDGAAPDRATAKVGGYPFLVTSSLQFSKTGPLSTDAAAKAFVLALRSNAGKSARLAALDADAQQGFLAHPSSWAGAYKDLATVAEQTFASRVDRASSGTCSPLRVIK
jgi:hypothetical protein